MRLRRPKGKPKTTCSNPECGKPLEKERIGKQRYCKACHTASMRQYRQDKKLEIENLKAELNSLKNANESPAK